MTRLLIADDHPLMLSGLQAVLRRSEFEIVGKASDGLAVLDALEATAPDILVLDLKMPKLTGLEVLRTLRLNSDARPVVLLTAHIDDQSLLESLRLGVNGIIMKDDAETLIRACLEKVRDGERWIQPSIFQRALDLATGNGPLQKGPLARLAPRERAISRLVREGLRNREIADELGLTEGTIKVCLHRMYEKLGISNRTELALLARDAGETI